jgi:hypothetical protein
VRAFFQQRPADLLSSKRNESLISFIFFFFQQLYGSFLLEEELRCLPVKLVERVEDKRA